MGKKMAGTNEFAFFAVKAYVPGGGVQNQAEKNSKNAFRPVPVQKFTFPAFAKTPFSWFVTVAHPQNLFIRGKAKLKRRFAQILADLCRFSPSLSRKSWGYLNHRGT